MWVIDSGENDDVIESMDYLGDTVPYKEYLGILYDYVPNFQVSE